MRLFSEHPNSTGGETGSEPAPARDGREALRLRLRVYCDRHILAAANLSPSSLDRRFTAFFTAAHRDGYVDADPEILARLFIALLANLDLRRASGAPTHELRGIAAATISFII